MADNNPAVFMAMRILKSRKKMMKVNSGDYCTVFRGLLRKQTSVSQTEEMAYINNSASHDLTQDSQATMIQSRIY